jgi:hypothetical protein
MVLIIGWFSFLFCQLNLRWAGQLLEIFSRFASGGKTVFRSAALTEQLADAPAFVAMRGGFGAVALVLDGFVPGLRCGFVGGQFG